MARTKDNTAPQNETNTTGALDLGLLHACYLLGAAPDDARCARPRTNSVLPARTSKSRVLLRSERLLDGEGARQRVEAVAALRAQGVPWAAPLDVLEVPRGMDEAPLTVTVWEWVDRADGPPAPEALRDAFAALHGAAAPPGLAPRFGTMAAELGRVREIAPWIHRLAEVETTAARWEQRSVVHGDPLSVNVLHRVDGTVCFIDPDMLAVGHPLADWQYLARDSRVDPDCNQVDWSLPAAVLDDLAGDAGEPGWQSGDHPLWHGQRLVHLWRKVAVWKARGCPAHETAYLERLAKVL